MLYRELGKTKEKVSILGFGAMRLPTKKSNADIDIEETEKMLKYGIENGINIIACNNLYLCGHQHNCSLLWKEQLKLSA